MQIVACTSLPGRTCSPLFPIRSPLPGQFPGQRPVSALERLTATNAGAGNPSPVHQHGRYCASCRWAAQDLVAAWGYSLEQIPGWPVGNGIKGIRWRHLHGTLRFGHGSTSYRRSVPCPCCGALPGGAGAELHRAGAAPARVRTACSPAGRAALQRRRHLGSHHPDGGLRTAALDVLAEALKGHPRRPPRNARRRCSPDSGTGLRCRSPGATGTPPSRTKAPTSGRWTGSWPAACWCRWTPPMWTPAQRGPVPARRRDHR